MAGVRDQAVVEEWVQRARDDLDAARNSPTLQEPDSQHRRAQELHVADRYDDWATALERLARSAREQAQQIRSEVQTRV
jgi:hypothetical protein